MTTHAKRIASLLKTIRRAKSKQHEPDNTLIVDLLADLRHYCAETNEVYADLDDCAAGHFDSERDKSKPLPGELSATTLMQLRA